MIRVDKFFKKTGRPKSRPPERGVARRAPAGDRRGRGELARGLAGVLRPPRGGPRDRVPGPGARAGAKHAHELDRGAGWDDRGPISTTFRHERGNTEKLPLNYLDPPGRITAQGGNYLLFVSLVLGGQTITKKLPKLHFYYRNYLFITFLLPFHYLLNTFSSLKLRFNYLLIT